MLRFSLVLTLAIGASGADPASIEKGKQEERRACSSCHSLRITSTQRLSRKGWENELAKMERWGATIREREPLLDYLMANYGDDKPMPKPPLTADGTKP